MLIAKGADINGGDCEMLPLGWAARGNHTDMIRLLLASGAKPNHRGLRPKTPVLEAVEAGFAESLKLLLEAEPEVCVMPAWKAKAALRLVLDKGDSEIMRLVLAHDAKVDKIDGWPSLLRSAIDKADTEILQLLLDSSFGDSHTDLDEQDGPDGLTILCEATRRGNMDLVDMLINSSAKFNARDDLERTPLMHAAECGQTEIVKRLIGIGSDINDSDHFNRTALTFASSYCRKEAVEVLLQQPLIKVDWRGIGDATALFEAARSGSKAVVELLLEKNADASIQSEDEQTPEDVAREKKFDEIVKLFENYKKTT
jgi:serine/threonine-protein phosphatase 6 regulatory ankyrin repeat subunit B